MDARGSYDSAAEAYAGHLAGKPLDRHLLNRFAAARRGLDLSPEMIRRATRLAAADLPRFTVIERVEREPYEGVEYPSRHCYLLARAA